MTTITLPISPLSSSNTFLQLMGDVNLIKTLAADARYYVANSTFQDLINNSDGSFVLNSGSVMKGPLALDFDGAVKLRLESNTAIESSILLNLEGSGNPDFKLTNDDNFKILKGNDGNTFDSNYLTILGTNGNIGIGTASPAVELQVETNSDTNIAIVSGTSGKSAIDFGDSDDRNAGLIQYLNADNAMTFRTSGSGEDLRIDSGGNVLIGTTDSTTDLAYQRKLKISGTGPVLYLEETDESQAYAISAVGAKLVIRDATKLVARMTIDSSGNMGIATATTSKPASKLNVAQGVTASSDGAVTPYFQLHNENAGTDLKRWRVGGLDSGSLTFDSVNDAYNASTTHMLIDSSGRVGIGVTSPADELDVSGNMRLRGTSTEDRRIEVGLGRTGNGNAFIDLIGDTTYSNYGLRLLRQAGANSPSQIMHRGTSGLHLRAQDAGKVIFMTNDIERARVSETGNVGIGTGAPAAKLHVTGTSGTGALIVAQSTSTSQYSSGGIALMNGATSNDSHVLISTFIRDSDSSDSAFTINQIDENRGYLKTLGQYDLSDHFWRFFTNNVERMRIGASGNIGIGTSSPQNKLHVAGMIRSSVGFVGNLMSSNGTKVIDNGTDGTDAKYEGLFWSYGGNKYNTETGTIYTLVRDDAGITKRINNGSGTTITVPANATVAFPIGTYINFVQEGAGQITFSAAGGVTLNHTDSHTKSKSRYAIVTLYKLDTNVWILGGSTAA